MASAGDVSAANAAFGGAGGVASPAGLVVGNALSGALEALLGGGPAPPAISNNASRINVAPVGVNVGEILRPFNEGSLTNGGFGFSPASRFVEGTRGQGTGLSFSGQGNVSSLGVIALAVGGVVLLAVLVRRRGR